MTNYQIESTTDYDKFKRTPGNRMVATRHKEILQKEIATHPETTKYSPILVNQRFEVIDGQHRLEVLQTLKQPVYYIQIDDLTLADAQRMNNINLKWQPIDYARSFLELGKTQYQDYLDFLEEVTIGHTLILRYFGTIDGTTGSSEDLNKLFKTGRFKIVDLDKTFLAGRSLMEVASIFKRATGATFAQAFLNIYKNPNYNHAFFMDALNGKGVSKAAGVIQTQDTVLDYMREIERVYNFQLPLDSQVRFF